MAVVINGTTGITNPNGSASAPAFTGQGSNTGLYFPTNTSVGLATGGVGRLLVDANGYITSPYNPAFCATREGTNQTGLNGSDNVIIFNTEKYDTTSSYDPSTGIFTAPVSGYYILTAVVLFTSITVGQQIDAAIWTSNRNYYCAPGRFNVQVGVTWSNDYIGYGAYTVADMDAGDTAKFVLSNTGSGTVAALANSAWTRFSGALIG